MNNFHYGLSLLDTLYGINIKEDDYEEIALTGWNLIGNKRTRIYRYIDRIDDCSKKNYIELPCNCEDLEAVTVPIEEWNYSTNDTPNGDWGSAWTEAYIEHRKGFKHPLYASGKFVRYERVGNRLYFDHPWGPVLIIYKGLELDEDGLPEITDKEAMALAAYCAYILKFKEGLMTNNPNIIRMADMLKLQWVLKCDLARVDHYMSQNEWDLILDVKTSWQRKQYGRSSKLYQI